MNRFRKVLLLFPLLLVMVGVSVPAHAAPYEGYNYSWWGEPEPAPVPYLPVKQVVGDQLPSGPFNSPEDIYITADKEIYVVDTGNSRIVRLDENANVTQIISTFTNSGKEDKFAAPQGIYVHSNGHLFVADSGNKRVVELSKEGDLIRIIGAPESDVLGTGFVYEPIKLVGDSAGRLYVVGKGVFNGIMQFDSGGKFTGFMGVNKVKYSAVDLFWKRVSTEEQRSKMVLFIPVEFNNVDIDGEGFIYATTREAFSDAPVKRLNPSGSDVLKRTGYHPPKGDIRFRTGGLRSGTSAIASVAIDQNGIYSILDTTRGRIFTYDREGKLMYIYGLLGEQVGTFKTPVDIDMLGDKMVVLDKGLNQLVIFEPTRYGSAIRDAVIMNDTGQEEMSVAKWHEVLSLNNNLEIAYLGIGKAELRQGHNYEAMRNFELGMHREYYSRAFERYRKEFMWEHFGKIMVGVLAAAVLLIAARIFIKRKETEPGVVGMAWYTIFHPFNGFWELKFEKKGRVWFALLLLLLLSLLYVLKRQYTGFIFNPGINDPESVNTIDEIKFIVLPFFMYCVANWSLTTLMDGEGKFKEIVIATAYALVPLILMQIPLILLSNIITIQEGSFYRLFESIGFLWFFGLLLVGMLTVHQYSVTKTIVTMVLTLIVIGIIIFLGLLFFSLVQQMLSFGTTVYKEAIFRIGEG
ncbi:YIP1 family protein [Paenibacillus mendelii]|uniref:YIP1 family protein n=1 Tax=Paenibacillus mendelii TaxID=206163 RepID=A0ABV6JJI1_9BACL|nr:YIP1 family protein [Paenibacillus mendelii]MCQ6559010.1 YIP1 family protein [Paenibacillus mendelii]